MNDEHDKNLYIYRGKTEDVVVVKTVIYCPCHDIFIHIRNSKHTHVVMKNENEEVINMINIKILCIYIGLETEDVVFTCLHVQHGHLMPQMQSFR